MNDGYVDVVKPVTTDGYISQEELSLIKQLERNAGDATKQCEIARLSQQKAHAEMRAAEAELRAAEAEYNGTIMKLLWKYKLENADGIRQSDGLIMKGEKNGTKENDAGSKS
ncbi:MAG: hypothetical protein CMB80_33345 [Flammeovirgaceae bacterium]|nr:hypothetical protein [Flammeovirgaceae bacterium]